jgi:hypothetical protein
MEVFPDLTRGLETNFKDQAGTLKFQLYVCNLCVVPQEAGGRVVGTRSVGVRYLKRILRW